MKTNITHEDKPVIITDYRKVLALSGPPGYVYTVVYEDGTKDHVMQHEVIFLEESIDFCTKQL